MLGTYFLALAMLGGDAPHATVSLPVTIPPDAFAPASPAPPAPGKPLPNPPVAAETAPPRPSPQDPEPKTVKMTPAPASAPEVAAPAPAPVTQRVVLELEVRLVQPTSSATSPPVERLTSPQSLPEVTTTSVQAEVVQPGLIRKAIGGFGERLARVKQPRLLLPAAPRQTVTVNYIGGNPAPVQAETLPSPQTPAKNCRLGR